MTFSEWGMQGKRCLTMSHSHLQGIRHPKATIRQWTERSLLTAPAMAFAKPSLERLETKAVEEDSRSMSTSVRASRARFHQRCWNIRNS